MTKPLNVNEPVQTQDGRKARIIGTDMKGPKPIVALITPNGEAVEEWIYSYFPDGRVYRNASCNVDLINVPRRIKGWMNVYDHTLSAVVAGLSNLYESREIADEYALSLKRSACIYIDIPEGEGL